MARVSSFRLQRGQAMIEAVIASALVLVPLFLAIPVLAKYMDIRSYTVQAARYAAWERTVWFGGDAAASQGLGSGAFSNKWDAIEKSDLAIKNEISKRLLSAKLSNEAFSSTNQSGATDRPLWVDRKGTALLKPYDGHSTTFDNDDAPGIINDLLTPLLNITAVVSNFTLDTKAQYTSKVGIGVREVAYNADTGLGGCKGPSCKGVEFLATSSLINFSEKNVLLANGWNANGPGSPDENGTNDGIMPGKKKISVYNQVRGITPTSILKPTSGVFKDILNVMQTVLSIFLPEISKLDLGKIDVDKVPADRLKP